MSSRPTYLPLVERDILQQERSIVNLFVRQSSWIWTPELTTGSGPPEAPGSEQRAFRKTYMTTRGTSPSNATIVITADNYFTMYINGALVHNTNAASDWASSIAITVPISGDKTVFAIRAVNQGVEGGAVGTPNAAGLRAAVGISFPGDSSPSDTFYTGLDQTWLGERIIPEGWEHPDFDDRGWKPAFVYNDAVKVDPWSSLREPTKILVGSTIPSGAGSSSTTTITLAVSADGAGAINLSSGAFAGVLVGVVAFVTAVVGLGTFFFMKRRFNRDRGWDMGGTTVLNPPLNGHFMKNPSLTEAPVL